MKALKIVLIVLLTIFVLTSVGLWLYTNHTVTEIEEKYPPIGEFVEGSGIRLHYYSSGAGRPIVLLHGDGGSVHDFTMSIFDSLTPHYRAVAFDRPGFGYSDRPDTCSCASPQMQALIIHDAVKRLGLEKPLLVGHSRSGPIVLSYALQFPEDISGVISLAGANYADTTENPGDILLTPIIGPYLAHVFYTPFGGPSIRAGLEWTFGPEGTAPPDFADIFVDYSLRPDQLLAVTDDQINSLPGVRAMEPRYSTLRPPLVIIQGDSDRNVSPAYSPRLHATVPGSHLIMVPGAGHMLSFQHPADVMQGIRRIYPPVEQALPDSTNNSNNPIGEE